jgi:MFS family permease
VDCEVTRVRERTPTEAKEITTLGGDFQKLWVAKAISTFGSGITADALPFIAALFLGASASNMGWLLATESAPVLLLGIFAGVWVDRVRRRPILVGADLGRAALLACIPLLAAFGSLRIEHLFMVGAAAGALTVLFDVAYQSFVPDLVGRDQILGANSRLAVVDATAEITTPGLTGALIQVIAAPLVILLDSVSFVGSALCILSIRRTESANSTQATDSVWRDIADGLRAVARNPTLRTLAGWEALRNFFGMFFGALYVLFGLRELGLSPVLIGLSVSVGGVSNFVGTLIVQPVTRRFGVGPTMIGASMIGALTPFLVALAPASVVGGLLVLVGAQALDVIHPLFDVNALTLRQVTTPPHLLGRVNATLHVLQRGAVPLGAIAGGLLGDAVGLRQTLLMGAAGIMLGAVWLATSLAKNVSDRESQTATF